MSDIAIFPVRRISHIRWTNTDLSSRERKLWLAQVSPNTALSVLNYMDSEHHTSVSSAENTIERRHFYTECIGYRERNSMSAHQERE